MSDLGGKLEKIDRAAKWSISSEGAPTTELKNFIQWKSTTICLDVWCECGKASHYDGMFAYYIKCDGCDTVYQLSASLKIRAFPEELEPHIEPMEPC